MTDEEKLLALDIIAKALVICEEAIGNLGAELKELENDLQDILEEG